MEMVQAARVKARAKGVLIPLLMLVLCAESSADSFFGKVVKVADGDTVTVLDGRERKKVRLYGIDAPEKKQAFGHKSKQMLLGMVAGDQVRVEVEAIDRYGRFVGRIFDGSEEVNLLMVEQGGAWVYRRYTSDARYYQAERDAKAARRGLWGLSSSERIPPWDWRRSAK